MQFRKAFIPYGGYWSTPFCRWQGSFAHLSAIPFAAEVATRALEELASSALRRAPVPSSARPVRQVRGWWATPPLKSS
jgi:hypothetical protein